MGKLGRDGAPSPVNPGDSATMQEVCQEGSPTRTRWGGYHLPHPVAPRGQKASSTRKIKPQTSNLQPGVARAVRTPQHPRCARNLSTHFL